MVVDSDQPVERSGVSAPESLELLHGPSDEVIVDAPCQEAQLGAVEDSVCGTALAGGPPRRSQRALLAHWAPA